MIEPTTLHDFLTLPPWRHGPTGPICCRCSVLDVPGCGPAKRQKTSLLNAAVSLGEAVGWSVFGTGDISILYPAWMVGMMIICLVMCALACGIYVDLYIYTVRLLMLLFRTLELPKFGKRTPSPAQIGKMIPAYFAKSIDLPKTLP